MRTLALTLLTALLLTGAADRPMAAGTISDVGTHITKDDVAATLKALPPNGGTEQIMKMVNAGKMDVGVAIMRRQVGTQSAVSHDSLTEVYYILSGSGVLVTGRDVQDPKPMDPNGRVVKELAGPSASGPTIRNGHSQHFVAGDTIIIPAGVGHWYSSLESTVDYLVVRIDPDRTIPIKE
ncbi:MAG TPA: cupin domain-containing protein [Vicinamibacterales bacterium]|jgi:mannose-6-phosphate isomerase-like protein (cupin superfamily)|nr:cupin domain-containing protein [Vicinamibacterales bacterium]